MSISTDDLLKEEVNAFRNGGKRYKKDYCNLRSEINKKSIDAAVALAYHDAQRTMTGMGKDKNMQHKKILALDKIKEELREYFSKKDEEELVHFCYSKDQEQTAEPSKAFDQTAFDIFHDYLCSIWHDEFKQSYPLIATYGKAQKIINMSFKYLFCCDDAPGMIINSHYEKHFRYCHMPLDSYTLEWYKQKNINKQKNYTWSKMEKDEYSEIQNGIRNNLNSSVDTPLETEFKVWPEIQKERARK